MVAEISTSFVFPPSITIDPTGAPVISKVPPEPKSNLSVLYVVRLRVEVVWAKTSPDSKPTKISNSNGLGFFILVVVRAGIRWSASQERDAATLVCNCNRTTAVPKASGDASPVAQRKHIRPAERSQRNISGRWGRRYQ